MNTFYTPSEETLRVLQDRIWICSYSGGKDSTSLVTWIEWLRRTGQIPSSIQPRLVNSDTEVEYPFLSETTQQMMKILTDSGWHCERVRPKISEKLYNQIFGRGLTPIHPAIRKMRWCTRATKIDPMQRFSKSLGEDTIQLTGVRWGESKRRDGALSLGGCAAGGECGLPEPDERVYGPIITWKTCQVIDWLTGATSKSVRRIISDLLEVTSKLIELYDVKETTEMDLEGEKHVEVSALRFGCIGCPAVSVDRQMEHVASKDDSYKPLRRIYKLWENLRDPKNRIPGAAKGKTQPGPIRMEARKKYFAKLMEIQRESGITLVTPEDEAYIRQCWADNIYPRGWKPEHEQFVEEQKVTWLGLPLV